MCDIGTLNKTTTSLRYIKEKNSDPKLPKPNLFRWHVPILAATCCILIGIFLDLLQLPNHSRFSSEGNFAFRETIRETRRAKTLATYARKRGPLIFSTLNHFSPLGSRGVTHLEDSIGGLISGPPNLWKHGEIIVSHRTKGIKREFELVDFKAASSNYWNNGISDSCYDRTIYIGGERVGVEEQTDQIQLAIGFLKFDCEKTVQQGYVSLLLASYHGGPLVGRIYRVNGSIGLDEYGRNDTSWDGTVVLNMEEIGAFIEGRGYGSDVHDIVRFCLMLVPFITWLVFSSRVGQCSVTVTTLTLPEEGSSKLVAVQPKIDTAEDSCDKSNKYQEFRQDLRSEGYLSNEVIKTYKLPMIYLCSAIVFPIVHLLTDDSGVNVIREILPEYRHHTVNIVRASLWIVSQELTAWALCLLGRVTHPFMNHQWNKEIVYAYQHSSLTLRTVGALNLIGAVVCVVDLTEVVEDISILLLPVSLAVFLLHLSITLRAVFKRQSELSNSCYIAGARKNLPLTTRSLAILFARQLGHSSSRRICSDEKTGMAFRGSIMDAAFLATPSLFVEAFFNSNVVQIQVREKSTESIGKSGRLVVKADHKFVLYRHWTDCGKKFVMIG